MESKFRVEQKQPRVTTPKLRRQMTAARLRTERKSKRENAFNQHRLDYVEVECNAERPVKGVRGRQFEAWKRTKEEAKRNRNAQEKTKPFIVSVVRHNVGSPYKDWSAFKTNSQPLQQTKKPVKPNLQRSGKKVLSVARVTRAMTRAAKLNETIVVRKRNEPQELAPLNFTFKAPKGIKPIPMSSNTQPNMMPKVLSAFAVTVGKSDEENKASTPLSIKKRSGKKSAKKSASVKGTPKSPLSCEPEIDVSHYRNELDSVVKQLENFCSEWSSIQNQFACLPAEVNDSVDVAIGQTKLLIKEKLGQYRGLINDCEKNYGPLKVTLSDLEGFWVMVNLQVQDVISKFERLSALKDNGWMEPKENHKSPLKKKKGSKISKTNKGTAKSSVREHIAALRRAKAVMQNDESTLHVADSDCVKPASKGETAQSNQKGKLTPATPKVVLIRRQLSENQKKTRRCSTTIMKITNQLREVGTPETAYEVNTKSVDTRMSGKRVEDRRKHLSPNVLNISRKTEFYNQQETPTGKKENVKVCHSEQTQRDMFSTKVILKDFRVRLANNQSPAENTQKNKAHEGKILRIVKVPPVSEKDKENLFNSNEEPHITPPSKTYSKSPLKSNKMPEAEEEFELLRKTPTFVHSSPSQMSREVLSTEKPHARRLYHSTRSVV